MPYNPHIQRPKSQYAPKQDEVSHPNSIPAYRPPSVDSKRPYINFAHSQTISQFPTPKHSIEVVSGFKP
jgi:hypothetical protein